MSCCSCNIQNCTPSDSLPRNCSDLCKAISTNPLSCHDTRDSRKSKAYFAAWRTRTTFSLSDLKLLSLIICVALDFFLITAVATKRLKQEHWCMHSVGDHERVNRVPHSTWHPYWGSPPLSQTYTQRTQSLQTGNWFVHQDFSCSKQAKLLLQISGKTTRDSRVSRLHLHIDSRVKEIPTPNPFQHSARQQSKEVAVWSYKISFQVNGGESSSRKSKTAALL